jgi:hypothetical protein
MTITPVYTKNLTDPDVGEKWQSACGQALLTVPS